MKLQFYYPWWGSEKTDFRDFASRVADAGYDGVEAFLPEEVDALRFRDALEKHGLKYIAQHALTLDPDFGSHRATHEKQLRRLARLDPIFLSSQTGRDLFSFEQNRELIAIADSIAGDTGVSILHETHRGRFSFAAHLTRCYLEELPDLRLTLDISHWCNVAESLLEDQQEAVDLAIARADHLHTRVGSAQSPQIIDPRSSIWEAEVEQHLSWWEQVARRMYSEGRSTMTMTVEFGPVPYTTVHPATGEPLVHQWEANQAIRDIVARRLSQLTK